MLPTRTLDVSVDSVRFVSEDEAEVHFTLWLSQFGAQGLNHTGHAVRMGDEWKVSRDTWCGLVRMIGVECPPPPGLTSSVRPIVGPWPPRTTSDASPCRFRRR